MLVEDLVDKVWLAPPFAGRSSGAGMFVCVCAGFAAPLQQDLARRSIMQCLPSDYCFILKHHLLWAAMNGPHSWERFEEMA